MVKTYYTPHKKMSEEEMLESVKKLYALDPQTFQSPNEWLKKRNKK